MFKKKCKRCGKKVNSKSKFCSNCGNLLNKNYTQEDWGMLGRDDFDEQEESINPFLKGLTGNMFNKMLGSAMKMLEKEMSKGMSRENSQPKTNIRLMINGKEIDFNKNSEGLEKKQIKKEVISKEFPKENLKKYSKLPKKEPLTNIRRLSNKVIYEIKLPGVKSMKDISITKLENSIEIKALSKDKAYFKSIPINLPITDYELLKGKLVLELEAKN